jgi:hypothetical protein
VRAAGGKKLNREIGGPRGELGRERRIPFDPGETRKLADSCFHDRLGQEADALAQDVDLAFGAHLAQDLEQGHAVVGHRGVLRVVGLLFQRREDDAVADHVHGVFAVTPV